MELLLDPVNGFIYSILCAIGVYGMYYETFVAFHGRCPKCWSDELIDLTEEGVPHYFCCSCEHEFYPKKQNDEH